MKFLQNKYSHFETVLLHVKKKILEFVINLEIMIISLDFYYFSLRLSWLWDFFLYLVYFFFFCFFVLLAIIGILLSTHFAVATLIIQFSHICGIERFILSHFTLFLLRISGNLTIIHVHLIYIVKKIYRTYLRSLLSVKSGILRVFLRLLLFYLLSWIFLNILVSFFIIIFMNWRLFGYFS